MKTISLTNSNKVVLVDDHNYPYLSDFSWSEMKSARTSYAFRTSRQPDGTDVAISMHRLIMGLPPGDDRQVDHIDGEGLNNLEVNLRIATPSQNQANRRR